jgi:hypothetical protein
MDERGVSFGSRIVTSRFDVQELVADGYKRMASEPDIINHPYLKPSLDETMDALEINS